MDLLSQASCAISIHLSPGAKLLFGGKALTNHSIPSVYGAIEPTAVFVPLKELLRPEYFPLATTEVFGPFQVSITVPPPVCMSLRIFHQLD